MTLYGKFLCTRIIEYAAMDCPHCPTIEPGCNYSITDIDGAAVVSLISSSLSILSSLCIIFTFFIWPEIRSVSRQIIVFLSLADLFTALGYVIGSANYLQYDKSNATTSDCEHFTRVCVVQSTLTSWSSIASFWWTSILGFHLYITLVKGRMGLSGKILPLYYLLSWVTPTIVIMALLWTNQLGYSSVAVSTWCFIRQKSRDQKLLESILILLGGKLWELIAYLTVVILYCVTKLHIRRQVSIVLGSVMVNEILQRMMAVDYTNLSTGRATAIRQIDQKLIFIPVMFILLRIWGSVQFIVISTVSVHHCQCVSHVSYIILYILAYLQVRLTGSSHSNHYTVYQ